jgi:hypothetical protein
MVQVLMHCSKSNTLFMIALQADSHNKLPGHNISDLLILFMNGKSEGVAIV